MSDLEIAKARLTEGGYTCVLKKGEQEVFSTLRGVKPLVVWIENGENFAGFSAADKVVGRATAFLYLRLGVTAVYARVISKAAMQVFDERKIPVEYDTLVERIINRARDGLCPFEEAVLAVQDEALAYAAIRNKMQEMNILI